MRCWSFLLWLQASGWQGPHLLCSLTSIQCWVDSQWIFLGSPKARNLSAGYCLENQEKLGHCNHCFSKWTCNSSSTQASERQLVHFWACYSAWRPWAPRWSPLTLTWTAPGHDPAPSFPAAFSDSPYIFLFVRTSPVPSRHTHHGLYTAPHSKIIKNDKDRSYVSTQNKSLQVQEDWNHIKNLLR